MGFPRQLEDLGGKCFLFFFFFFFYIVFFLFSLLAGLQCSVSFSLYSKVTQSHIHTYILFSHMILLYHE